AARRLHADRHVFALAEAPAAHAHAVDEKLRAAVVRVDDLATAVAPDERTDVAHLTARLGVSRGAIEDHLDLGALRHFGHTPLPLPPLGGEELLDLLHADVERLREALFLLADDLLDASALGHQLRIGRLHHGGDPIDRLVEERLVESEPAAVAHGPAHDPAQD